MYNNCRFPLSDAEKINIILKNMYECVYECVANILASLFVAGMAYKIKLLLIIVFFFKHLFKFIGNKR